MKTKIFFLIVMLCGFLGITQTNAATSIETIHLGDSNIFYGGDGGAYRIKNESFYSNSLAVKGKAVEVITFDGKKLYIPQGELVLSKLPTKIEMIDKFAGAAYMETQPTSAGVTSSVSNYFIKDGYYWFVPYSTDSDGKFMVTVIASPYNDVFPDTGFEKYKDCVVVYDESFLSSLDTMNLSCGGAPIKMFPVNDKVLDGIANKEAFMKRLTKDFNFWDSKKKTILAENAGEVIDWLRAKAKNNGFSNVSKGYSFLTSLGYDEETRKAIDASKNPTDLQSRLAKINQLTHSGLATLINGVGVCDGISTAGFYLYQLSGLAFYVREGEVDDTTRGGKKFPHAWLVYGSKTYDATLDIGKRAPEYKGITATEIAKKSPRVTFK